MSLQVLSLLIVVSLLGFTSCNTNNAKTDAKTFSWRFPISRGTPKAKFGRQMPPHSEPDAVLINVGQDGQPRRQEGGFPGLPGGPGIFGEPRDPTMFAFPNPGINTGPDVFGIPQGPGVFGIPQGPGVFGIPQGPDVYGIPQGPGVFGIPQGPDIAGIPQGPGIFGHPQGPDISGIPQGPGVFGIPQNPDGPQMPGAFGIPRLPGFPDTFAIPGIHIIPRNPAESGGPSMFVPQLTPTSRDTHLGQSRPGFVLRTRIFVTPSGLLQPGEMFGQRGVFTVAGNVPFPGVPNFFYTGRGPNAPGMFPETFGPTPEGTFPNIFYPEPKVPNPPRDSSGGNFPEWEEGREINDEPIADSFPLIDKSKVF